MLLVTYNHIAKDLYHFGVYHFSGTPVSQFQQHETLAETDHGRGHPIKFMLLVSNDHIASNLRHFGAPTALALQTHISNLIHEILQLAVRTGMEFSPAYIMTNNTNNHTSRVFITSVYTTSLDH